MTRDKRDILWIIVIGFVSMLFALIAAFVFNIRDARLPGIQLISYIILLFVYGWIKKGSMKAWLKEFI